MLADDSDAALAAALVATKLLIPLSRPTARNAAIKREREVDRPARRRLHSPGMKVGIIGLGYVGLPLAVAFAEAGHDVVGVDVSERVVEGLNAGRSQVEDVSDERLAAAGRAAWSPPPTSGALAECDAVLICVPTPLANQREPDLAYIADAGRSLAAVLREGQLVVLESTTYPGTTRERLQPILEESGLAAGRDFYLAFSPERIDPGRTDHTIRDDAEGGGRPHRRLPRPRGRALLGDLRRGDRRSPAPRRPR